MNKAGQHSLTQMLRKHDQGEQESFDALFQEIYDELYLRAHQKRKRWSGDNTLNTTALLHETYLKLVDQNYDDIQSRACFYATASKAMRHILINYARDQKRLKRGGSQTKLSLDALKSLPDGNIELSGERSDLLLSLDKALKRLEKTNTRQSRIIECRFFGGMTIEDTAAALGISPKTVKRSWNIARLWLYREMQ